ncbi:unnamed protein product [Parnassius apollo]|uniref:(apollo) hypothetical protein n=1 Tax=Parnassius apollo TaxID=110799 RepID=A0A8S3XPL7_PARAO|nr:unnamed protein product [Parnassius apollo]
MALPNLENRSVLNVVEENFQRIGLGSEDTVHRQLRFLLNLEVQWLREKREQDKEEEKDESSTDESVWPLPTHYTPRLLYKLKIDDSFVEPLPVMPWELAKKEVEEEGMETAREEEQSVASSDSD